MFFINNRNKNFCKKKKKLTCQESLLMHYQLIFKILYTIYNTNFAFFYYLTLCLLLLLIYCCKQFTIWDYLISSISYLIKILLLYIFIIIYIFYYYIYLFNKFFINVIIFSILIFYFYICLILFLFQRWLIRNTLEKISN